MKPCLLDVNILIALTWPDHVFHNQSRTWFWANRDRGFSTCPMTQTGFVRISSNPNFRKQAPAPRAALGLLHQITALPRHSFWPDDLSLSHALDQAGVIGHQQVTDAYLIALAASRGGVLATLDRGLVALAGTAAVEYILPI